MLFSRLLGAQGMTFGVMDGVITTLGVLAGLNVLGDRAIVIAGMLIAGFADSFANAAGIHVSQETEGEHSQRDFFKYLVAVQVVIIFREMEPILGKGLYLFYQLEHFI